jgi:hypothetical protein
MIGGKRCRRVLRPVSSVLPPHPLETGTDDRSRPMNAEHERLKEILAEATAKASPTERAAYLDVVCRGDPALRSRVESMLAAHDRAGGFLEEPVQGGDRAV